MDKYIISYQTWNRSSMQITSHGNLAFSYNTEEMGAIAFFNFVTDKAAKQADCSKDCVLLTGVFRL